MNKKKWTRYLVPGFIFQSVIIGGGYGTGSEIYTSFSSKGLVNGIFGLIATTLVWSLLCAITFEFTHAFKTYDYGSMMKKLIGKFAFLYDILYYLMMFIVLGVLNSTANSMFKSLTGLSGYIGVAILTLGIVFLVFKGTAAIEKALSFWSYVLYAVYIIFLIAVFAKFGSNIADELANPTVTSGFFESLGSGFSYSIYNLVVVPLILYTVRDCDSYQEAGKCGVISGFIAVIPGVLLHLAMGCNLAGIADAVAAGSTPIAAVFDMLNMKWLYIAFEVVLFGTLIETGTGFIKAVTDRVSVSLEKKGKKPGQAFEVVFPLVILAIGIGIGEFGLFNLIVKGYNTSTWGFLIIYALPMVIIGTIKVVKARKAGEA